MPRLSQKTQEARKYQAEQYTLAAARINDVMCFFHAEVLHCFIPLTMVRTLLLIIFLILGRRGGQNDGLLRSIRAKEACRI